MADLLPNKLCFRSPCYSPFSFPLYRSPLVNFSIIRFSILGRRRRLSHSSVLATPSPDSTRYDIVSTSEQSDGSVVFKFGYVSDAEPEAIASLDDEQHANFTNSELVGASHGEYEVNLGRESVSDARIAELDDIDSSEVEGFTISKDQEKDNIEFEDSTESKPEEDKNTEVRDLVNNESEPESFTQVTELVGSIDARADLQSGTQCSVDCIEDNLDYCLISTVEIKNATNSDVETNSLTVSDSKTDLVIENLNDYEVLDNERIDSVVTTLDCNMDSIMEKFQEMLNVELATAVSSSQLELDGNDLLEIGEKSSCVEDSELAVSLDDSELESNGKLVGNERDGDNDTLEIPEINPVIDASDMGVALEDVELENSLKQVAYGENVDDKSQESIDMNSLASDSNLEQVANEENVNEKFPQNLDMNPLIAASGSNSKQVAEEKEVDDRSQEMVDMIALIEASSSHVKHVVNEEDDDDNGNLNLLMQGSDTGVSLEDDELESDINQVENQEDNDNDVLEIAETYSPTDASDLQVSLEDDKLESSMKQIMVIKEVDDNKLKENADSNLPVEASSVSIFVEDSETDSNVKHMGNEEDLGNVLELSETNSPIEASEMTVSLEDDKLESFINQDVENGEVDDNILKENAGLNLPVETSSVSVFVEDSETDSNMKHVGNEEDLGNVLELSETNSPIEALEMTMSLEDDKLESFVNQVVENGEAYDNILEENAGSYSLVKASNMEISLDNSEFSKRNSPIEDSETAVSLQDVQIDSSVNQVLANKEEDESKLQEVVDMNMLVDVSDIEVSLSETRMVNENDWVELMEKPTQLDAEPILDEEVSCSGDNVITLESTSSPNMVDDAPPSLIPLSDDALFENGLSKAASHNASYIVSAEVNEDSVSSVEIVTPTHYLLSAATSLPHDSEALTGGADAYFVCQNWFGVADGVGQWSFGGTDRGRYAHELMQNCEKVALNSQSAGLTDVKDTLQQIAAMTESTGAARVLIAHFADQALHVANFGDTGFVIVRNGKIFKKSSPMFHEFNFPYAIGSGVGPLEAVEEYHIELEDGDVIVAATDGLFDNLYEQEIASVVSKSLGAQMEPKELAELLVSIAQELGSSAHGRSPFADAAQAAGHTGVIGGKLDHVTVIVSLVKASK